MREICSKEVAKNPSTA